MIKHLQHQSVTTRKKILIGAVVIIFGLIVVPLWLFTWHQNWQAQPRKSQLKPKDAATLERLKNIQQELQKSWGELKGTWGELETNLAPATPTDDALTAPAPATSTFQPITNPTYDGQQPTTDF